jgi:hypothetical protein
MTVSRSSRLVRNAFFVALNVALIAAGTAAGAQTGSGAPYGSRDARKCKVAAPRGAPSAAVAAQAFICNAEHEDGRNMWLYQNVSVQVGRGRPFQMGTDAFEDVDPSAAVYPIRGSFVQYMCGRRSTVLYGQDPNKLCFHEDEPNASGLCYTTTFGDLRCTLDDLNAQLDTQHPLPPPR